MSDFQIQQFESLYNNTEDYLECKVLNFTEGSIIVNYALIFKENSTVNTTSVNDTIQEELAKPEGGAFSDVVVDEESIRVEGTFWKLYRNYKPCLITHRFQLFGLWWMSWWDHGFCPVHLNSRDSGLCALKQWTLP